MAEDIRQNINIEQEEEGLNLLELWYIVLKRWKLTSFVLLVLLAASSLYTYQNVKKQVPMYTSSTKITLGSDTLRVKDSSGDIIEQAYDINSEVLLLESNIIAERAASLLKDKYGYRENHKDLVGIIRSAFKRGKVLGITRGTEKLGQSSSTIIITSYTNSPQLSFDVISAVLEGYKQEKIDSENKFYEDAYRIFNQQLDIAHEELGKSENKLSKFIINNQDIITMMEDLGLSKYKEEKLVSSAVNEIYINIKKDFLTKQAFLNKIKVALDKDMLTAYAIIKKEESNLLKEELEVALFEKEQFLAKLLQINEERHPAVIQARGEIESIKMKMLSDIERVLDDVTVEAAELEQKEAQIAALMEGKLYEVIIEYSMLKKDILTKRDAYDKFAEALQKIDIGEKLSSYTEIKVLEPHVLANKSEKKIPYKEFAILVIFSFATAIGLAYLLEKLDRSIKDVKELERITHKPVIATVPNYKK